MFVSGDYLTRAAIKCIRQFVRVARIGRIKRFARLFVAATLIAPGATALAGVLHTTSTVHDIHLDAASRLPRAPKACMPDVGCDAARGKHHSAWAREIEKLGWIVTSEAPLGPYQVVTFVNGFDGAYGEGYTRDAHIAIFRQGTLVALAHMSSALAADYLGSSLGDVEPLENGALLIHDGYTAGVPLGELHADKDGLHITPVSPERTFCHGRATVPNIYGKSIKAARVILMRRGWKPERPKGKIPSLWQGPRGVIEAQGCAGTGVGYCGFDYRNPAGVLSVATVGGDLDPSKENVVSYKVKCSAR